MLYLVIKSIFLPLLLAEDLLYCKLSSLKSYEWNLPPPSFSSQIFLSSILYLKTYHFFVSNTDNLSHSWTPFSIFGKFLPSSPFYLQPLLSTDASHLPQKRVEVFPILKIILFAVAFLSSKSLIFFIFISKV